MLTKIKLLCYSVYGGDAFAKKRGRSCKRANLVEVNTKHPEHDTIILQEAVLESTTILKINNYYDRKGAYINSEIIYIENCSIPSSGGMP